MSEATEFEKEKWSDEVRLRTRELDIKDAEAQESIRVNERSRWTSPLVLGIFAATLAGFGNAVVAWMNGKNQENLEMRRNEQERTIEEAKAESARILEVVKTGDPDKAAENLSFLLNIGLISNPKTRSKIADYLTTRKGGEGISITFRGPTSEPGGPITTTVGPPLIEKPQENNEAKFLTFETGWVSGGHSQAWACQLGLAKLQPQHPDKKFEIVSSHEKSRRDILQHVTYNYTCKYRLTAK